MTTAAEAKAVLSRWYDEMWSQKNFALVPEIAGPVYTRHEANGTRQVTAEEYRDALAGSLSEAVVEDLRYRLIAEDDRVVAIGTWKTTIIAKIGEKEYRATFDQKVTG